MGMKRYCCWIHCVFIMKWYTRVERSLLKSMSGAVQCLLLTDFGMVQENIQLGEKGSEVWVRREEGSSGNKESTAETTWGQEFAFLGGCSSYFSLYVSGNGFLCSSCILEWGQAALKCSVGLGPAVPTSSAQPPEDMADCQLQQCRWWWGLWCSTFSWASSILFWVNQRLGFAFSLEEFWACLKSSDRPWLCVLGPMTQGIYSIATIQVGDSMILVPTHSSCAHNRQNLHVVSQQSSLTPKYSKKSP